MKLATKRQTTRATLLGAAPRGTSLKEHFTGHQSVTAAQRAGVPRDQVVEPETGVGLSPISGSSPADATWQTLQLLARKFRFVEQTRIAFELRVGAYARSGLAGLDAFANAVTPGIDGARHEEKIREREVLVMGRATEFADFVQHTRGLGPATFLAIALMPHHPSAYRTVACYWKAAGMHPHGRPQRGVKLDYAPWRFGIWYRLVKGLMSKTVSDYRACYDARIAWTKITHPEPPGICPMCQRAKTSMLEDRVARAITRERTGAGRDCANLGGPHWSQGHRHNDAVRFMLKAVLRDVWRVAHGQEPLFSS